jgi:hypothetical protein
MGLPQMLLITLPSLAFGRESGQGADGLDLKFFVFGAAIRVSVLVLLSVAAIKMALGLSRTVARLRKWTLPAQTNSSNQ